MCVLVTGVSGQVGYEVVEELKIRKIPFIAANHSDMDITSADSIKKFIGTRKINAIIHCAAYTAVDLAEEEVDICYKVNVNGTKNLVKVCKEQNALFTFVSTDYVFDGTKQGVYTEEDITNPINVYGRSKQEAEEIIKQSLEKYFVVRTSWVFGRNGKNFVDTIRRIASANQQIKVVADQVGAPTYALDLAKVLCDLLKCQQYGIYHVTNKGFCSWYEFAMEIVRISGFSTEVMPISSSEFPTKAKRPKNSRMSGEKIAKTPVYSISDWKTALIDYLKQ